MKSTNMAFKVQKINHHLRVIIRDNKMIQKSTNLYKRYINLNKINQLKKIHQNKQAKIYRPNRIQNKFVKLSINLSKNQLNLKQDKLIMPIHIFPRTLNNSKSNLHLKINYIVIKCRLLEKKKKKEWR